MGYIQNRSSQKKTILLTPLALYLLILTDPCV
jgi:hypothetical protein